LDLAWLVLGRLGLALQVETGVTVSRSRWPPLSAWGPRSLVVGNILDQIADDCSFWAGLRFRSCLRPRLVDLRPVRTMLSRAWSQPEAWGTHRLCLASSRQFGLAPALVRGEFAPICALDGTARGISRRKSSKKPSKMAEIGALATARSALSPGAVAATLDWNRPVCKLLRLWSTATSSRHRSQQSAMKRHFH
jgi:hypothetical protein